MMNFFGAQSVQSGSASQSAQSSQSKTSSQKKDEFSPKRQKITRFCTNCGAPLEADDLFCSECGGKIEEEETAIAIEKDEEKAFAPKEAPVTISSDRMASILESQELKKGRIPDSLKKKEAPALAEKKSLPAVKNSKLCGNYVSNDSYMTQYLTISSIQGNNIKAFIKTIFNNGGYSTEFYEGSLNDNQLHLHMVDSDLHPPPDDFIPFLGESNTVHHTIRTSENFDGIIGDNTITGSYAGQFSKAVTFKKC